jgi:hypothetical protein
MKSIIFWDMTPCATCLLTGVLNYSSTLKMEAIRSSETSGTTQWTTRHHIPEDDTLAKELLITLFLQEASKVAFMLTDTHLSSV